MIRAFLIIMLLARILASCDKQTYHNKPYEEFAKVGLLGHGKGILGEIGVNVYSLQRRCDSCHKLETQAHAELGTCNNCHQPHDSGWKKSNAALYHGEVLRLDNRMYHFRLKCKDCHQELSSREAYRETKCIHCHNHTKSDIQYAHELMNRFDMKLNNKDSRCIDCHVKTGKEYAQFYDPVTDELL